MMQKEAPKKSEEGTEESSSQSCSRSLYFLCRSLWVRSTRRLPEARLQPRPPRAARAILLPFRVVSDHRPQVLLLAARARSWAIFSLASANLSGQFSNAQSKSLSALSVSPALSAAFAFL